MTHPITFRLIEPDDIPLLHQWRNLPHVSRWWQPQNPSLEHAHAEYTAYMRPDHNVAAYMVHIHGNAVGYIQKWQVQAFPDYKPYVPSLPDAAVGVDVFIGAVDYLHQGWGTQLITRFICDFVFNDPTVPEAIIDPLPANHAAIRAYEKVGFVHVKTFTHDGSGVYFMRLERETLTCG